MGRLFELDGQQYELFSGGADGVWYMNLTTQQKTHVASPRQVPEHWPQDVKDSLRTASFVRFEYCPVCGMPETPLCGCTHGLDDEADWRVPRVLSRDDPPHHIDPLRQTTERATTGLSLLCLLPDCEARKSLAHKVCGLFAEHTRRQELIADQWMRHYERTCRVLRNYARRCHETIADLWRERRQSYRQSRRELVDAVAGNRECLSCHDRRELCVAVPCCHASMCAACWEAWGGTQHPTCPECRGEIHGLHAPAHKTGTLRYQQFNQGPLP